MNIIEKFFNECISHWQRENARLNDIFNPHYMALKDIKAITRNPYSMYGALLDVNAKQSFINEMEQKGKNNGIS